MMQDKIFKQSEGDNWFKRNKKALTKKRLKKDLVLKVIKLFNIKPKKVLELGCATGYRLSYLKNKYSCQCVGVDCSSLAIKYGQSRYKGIRLFCGGIDKLNFRNAVFDLIIVNFVFHWIDRELIASVIAECDRVLRNEGLIIIADFFPLYPKKVKYHHLKDHNVYTYKEDYSKMFEKFGYYQSIGRISAQCGTQKICVQLKYDFRSKVDLLLKDSSLKK